MLMRIWEAEERINYRRINVTGCTMCKCWNITEEFLVLIYHIQLFEEEGTKESCHEAQIL